MGPSTPSSSSANAKAMSRNKVLRVFVFGFVVGLCASNMIAMIRESDANLRHSTLAYDMAAGAIPFLYNPPCDDNSTTTLTTTAAATSTTTTSSSSGVSSTTTPKPPPNNNNAVVVTKDIIEPQIVVDSDSTVVVVNDFDPNLPAVLVTKIHGPKNIEILEQAICLLHFAYNYRVHYDIIVFSAEPIPEEMTHNIRNSVAPANVYFILDNPGLHEMVEALSPERKNHLLWRCGLENDNNKQPVTSVQDLTWYTNCLEIASTYNISERISYSWQAEFRSKHLWVHPAMQKYKYMLWFDSDAFCTKVWQQDPIATMARNDLVILFDHFPQGHGRGHELPYRTKDAFDKVICNVDMKNGTLFAKTGRCLGKDSRIKLVHGFMHVTNLDFYRSPAVTKWNNVFIGDTIFSRIYDDQIAVTIPAAVLAGSRAWDMRKHGIHLEIIHNAFMDGEKTKRMGNYVTWWHNNAPEKFPEAYGQCKVTAGI